LYGGEMDEKGSVCREPDLELMRSDLFGIAISEMDTRKTIADAFNKYGILLEPHGAVAWKGLECYRNKNILKSRENEIFISLETAHPAKFPEEIKKILGFSPDLPPSLSGLNEEREEFIQLDNNYLQLRKLLPELLR
jgi:threonine synthase